MRKEIIVAVIMGLILGMVIAYGIYRTNQTIDNKIENTNTNNGLSSPSEDTSINNEVKLTVIEPENLDGIIENPITLSGLTQQNSYVVVSSENDDVVLKSDTKGGFSTTVNLLGGINQILVKSPNPDKLSDGHIITLVYSSEFIKQLKNDLSLPTSTPSSTVDGAVLEKVELTKSNPKVFMGSITDATESTLQLKNGNSEIQLISITPSTTYAKIGKTTTEVKQVDVAIGDYIAVLGTVNEQKVMKAIRILLVTPPEPPRRNIFWVKVNKYTAKTLSVSYGNNAYTIPFVKNLKVSSEEEGEIVKSSYSDIEKDDSLIVIGEIKEKIITPRKIHIIKPAS